VVAAVERAHLVQEDVEVERQRLGHAVLAVMGREVVVPLPDLADEGGLHVDLDLLDIELGAQDLLRRLDQARMAHQLGEHRIAQVQGHGGAHLAAVLLADVRRVVLGEQSGQRCAQRRDLGVGKQLRQDQKAVPLEGVELVIGEPHWRRRPACLAI
jgi:hypothetical protein